MEYTLDQLRDAVTEMRAKAEQARAQGYSGLTEDNTADWLEQQVNDWTVRGIIDRAPLFVQNEMKKGYQRCKETRELKW